MSLLKAAEVEINFTQIKLWGQIDFLKSSLRKSSVHIYINIIFFTKICPAQVFKNYIGCLKSKMINN
jgi:hypothetical protein